MRIGYVVADGGIPVFGSKGASVHVRELVRALARGHDVDLFCSALGEAAYHLPVRRIVHVPRPTLSPSDDPALDRDRARLAGVDAMTAQVAAAHAADPYDLIYERYSLFSTAGLSLAQSRGVPLLLEVNAPLIAERQRVEPLPLAPPAHEREQAVFRGAGAVLCVSEAMACYARAQGAVPGRVHVIPNGVDISRFNPAVSGDEVRSRYGLGSALTIGFVGSLKAWHGVDLLLHAFWQAAEPDWRLLIVGEGPEGPRLKALAGALGVSERVLFVGAVHHDAIPAHVGALDVAVAPYRSASDFYFSPLKLYEYLAAGRAVLATDAGQIAVALRHLDNGYLVPPDDVAALAAGLGRLASDGALRSALQARAPRGVASWEHTAQRVLDIAHAVRRAA